MIFKSSGRSRSLLLLITIQHRVQRTKLHSGLADLNNRMSKKWSRTSRRHSFVKKERLCQAGRYSATFYIQTMVTSGCQTAGHNLKQPPFIWPPIPQVCNFNWQPDRWSSLCQYFSPFGSPCLLSFAVRMETDWEPQDLLQKADRRSFSPVKRLNCPSISQITATKIFDNDHYLAVVNPSGRGSSGARTHANNQQLFQMSLIAILGNQMEAFVDRIGFTMQMKHNLRNISAARDEYLAGNRRRW